LCIIGGGVLVIGDLPIELSAYLCRLWLFWEADRRDRPVRGLSSLFTKSLRHRGRVGM
jgi:hypothetical protein